ncbi:MAG: GTPase [Calditrichaeota bacterium]|nr:GTPase [Calditrichota bacterium]MCB9367114.1 GTPase [Calditrichota bacterium]MCB9391886.1 GTPase [Calditrichota bacterium]
MKRIKTIIQGAAGRDFHNFNTVYRDNETFEVVAFTAAQIPGIEDRTYPAVLAGKLYPKGIKIHPESELEALIKKHEIDEVVYSYSDVKHEYVMHWASRILASGANFKLVGGRETMIKSTKPVVAVCAVRTGAGKSQTTRRVAEILKAAGKKVVAIRHPMPYGDLSKQIVQRFGSIADLKKHKCTIEEMEEYEPHIARGQVIYAGVDYEKILREAEKEADVILWDGGNNDLPFYKPDVYITVADPLRAGNEMTYYPGETNFRMADVLVINKVDSAAPEQMQTLRASIEAHNPKAMVIDAASPIKVEQPELIRGKRVLVIEDGPTCTHGEMKYGAGVVAAKKYGAAEMVDPRPFAVGLIAETFRIYPGIGSLLPAMGYGEKQMKDLEATITKAKVDAVIIATPIDLGRVIKITKPHVRVMYDLQEIGEPTLHDALAPILSASKKSKK